MPLTVTALAAEINTDPRSYGYAADVAAGNDSAIAEKLNLVRTGSNGGPAITIRKADIASKDLWESIDVEDYTDLPPTPNSAALSTERRFLAWLAGLATIPQVRLLNDDGTNTPVITNLQAMFPAGSGTRARILALATRNGSRAEELGGAGTTVSAFDVARALGRG